jgi:hypothetical protein
MLAATRPRRLVRTLLLATSMPAAAGMSTVRRPTSLKLYYGDMPFWRAEVIRLGLFIGEVPFEDIRDQKRDDLKAAGKLTFGAVPGDTRQPLLSTHFDFSGLCASNLTVLSCST